MFYINTTRRKFKRLYRKSGMRWCVRKLTWVPRHATARVFPKVQSVIIVSGDPR